MDKSIERTKDGVDHLIDRTRDVVVGAAARAERGLGSAAGRVAEKAQVAGAYLRDGAECATRSAHQRLESAAAAVDRGVARAKGDLSRAVTATTDRVVAHPGKALLIAAAAGMALGLLIHRRQPSF
jgi:ElaB/YqjD/DUF883 family membrane-anchored ribosome-binding protein